MTAARAKPTWTDVFKNQDTSVAKAKKAIADYKKAVGPSQGLAELMVFIGYGVGHGMDHLLAEHRGDD